MVQISTPRFEQHHDGFGVNSSRPRLSWRFTYTGTSDTHIQGWRQQAYDIRIDGQEYHVRSENSTLVPWPAPSLRSRQIAVVQIRCYGCSDDIAIDAAHELTEWSLPGTVEVGLLEREEWQARLISTQSSLRAEDGSLSPIRFRKTFTVPCFNVTKARLYVTCHGVYEARLNGIRIGNHHMSPGWTAYHHRLNYQIFDVLPYLKRGACNVLAVEISPGWYASALGWCGGRRFYYGDRLALLAQLEIDTGEATIKICSDGSWRYNASAVLSSELYNGEALDMKAEEAMHGWDLSPEFDDNDWKPTTVGDIPPVALISPNAPPVRITQTIRPVSTFRSRSGKMIIDFGQNLVGRLRVRSLKGPPGSIVSFQHAEVMEKGELGTRPLRAARSQDSIVFSTAELSNWSPKFTFHGFRFVQVNGGTECDMIKLTVDDIVAEVLHTDLERIGHFSCSHPMVNKLHENAVWSMRGNFLSLPTDCPQRDERLGWTGDIQIFASSASFLYDVSGMLGNWLEDLAAEQAEPGRSGIPPLVVPNVIEKKDSKDTWWPLVPQAIWGDCAVLVPWTLYQASGDIKILQDQYNSMKTWLDHGVQRGPGRLWDEDVWQLGDWLDPNASPHDPADGRTDGALVADSYLVHVTRTFAQICRILGSADADSYEQDSQWLKKEFQDKYVTRNGLLVGDTQTALSLAIVFGLVDGTVTRAKTAARLGRLVKRAGFKVATGFAGTPIICHALTATSQPQLAYRMLLNKDLPSWMYPVQQGATTMWERWDSMLPDGTINPGEMTSFNHYALGSVISWLHEHVGGLSPLQPGWKQIKVQPVPGGTLTSADIAFDSPYGRVKCSWEWHDEAFRLHLQVPPNSQAFVILPGKNNEHVKGTSQGQWVGSGNHSCECHYQAEDWPPRAVKAPYWDQTQPEYV